MFCHLLDYRHKEVNDRRYVTACRRQKGLIQETKLLVGAPTKETVLLLSSPVRRTSTEAVRITSCFIGWLIGHVLWAVIIVRVPVNFFCANRLHHEREASITQAVGLASLALLLAYGHNNIFSGTYVMIEVLNSYSGTHSLEYYCAVDPNAHDHSRTIEGHQLYRSSFEQPASCPALQKLLLASVYLMS